MIVELLNQFDPDPDVLLREVSLHVSDLMLKAISFADYGKGVDEQLIALRQVRDTGTFPSNLSWVPMEVLELIRWSEPEDPKWKPGETGEFGHWMRAFSCAAVLRAQHEPYCYGYNDGSTDNTVVQLVLSIEELPVNFDTQAARTFAWLLLRSAPEGSNDQVCSYGLALLWFALKHPTILSGEQLVELAQWVIRRADELYDAPAKDGYALSYGYLPPRGYGLREMVVHCQKGSSWEALARGFLDLDLSGRSTDLQVYVQAIGEQLLT